MSASRGVSNAFSASILILVAVSLSALVGYLASIQTQAASIVEDVEVLDASLIDVGGRRVLAIEIANTGSVELRLELVELVGTPCSWRINEGLGPGTVYSGRLYCGSELDEGKYVVRVVARAPDGREVNELAWAGAA